MRAHAITTTKLALLLSLLALGALGLVACGEGDDEGSATEAKVSAGHHDGGDRPPPIARLSREQVQELKREANTWASLFAVRACNRYMGQPMCERITCNRHGEPIENCTPVSAAFQKSFADATVEDIKSERIVLVGWTDRPLYEAAVKFSNGEVVMFGGGAPGPEPPAGSCPGAGSGVRCVWGVADLDQNRRFVEAAAPRE
jgi:hypothetical protein